jgi:3-deoxy-D-manno-octulosonic-acid transferase
LNHSLYNIGIFLYSLIIRLVSPFNQKAKLWIEGRSDVFEKLEKWRAGNSGRVVWFHAASLGEFEQGRPVIEEMKNRDPHLKVVLSFFSPSGYEIRKNYSGADLIVYLPSDSPSNAKRWVKILKPDLAVFIKYEFWANYFFQLKANSVPLIVISAIFRSDQRFFGSQKAFWKEVLDCVDHFFVQNQISFDLLKRAGNYAVTLAGDTRYDRVIDIAKQRKDIPFVSSFIAGRKCIVGGSTYSFEEKIIQDVLKSNNEWCAVVAPHEIEESRIQKICDLYGSDCIRFSKLENRSSEGKRVLIIDNIGMLSSLYAYATISVIGGGFGKGIHNTLEAAVYGIPVVFGPKYKKFEEAVLLVESGAALACDSEEMMIKELDQLMKSETETETKGAKCGEIVAAGSGAMAIIMKHLETFIQKK